MTREEIINGLEIYTVGRLNKDRVHITVEELQKFIDEIKTLEQEPSNDMVSHEVFDEYGNYKYPSDFELTEPNMATSMPCGDAISRQAALDCFTATKLKKFDFILYARKKIKKLPPVTPQPKIGKWIKSQDMYGNNHFTCPFCEHDIATIADTWKDNYCSNCGAKMQEVER